MGVSEHDGEAYGRHLAERIIVQARQYDLNPRDMAVQHVDREALQLRAQGVSLDEISQWCRGVTIGCRLRIDDEAGQQPWLAKTVNRDRVNGPAHTE
jgi:hypothetical protein